MKNLRIIYGTLLLSACFAAQAQAQAQVKAPASQDLDAAWEQMLAQQTYDDIIKNYDPVFEVEQSTGDPVDKEKCVKFYPALKAGAQKLPASIALSYWSYRCAEVAGSDQEAEKYLQHFSLVAKHAFAQASDQSIARPIRVIHHVDISALLAASDMEVIEQYFDTSDIGRYLPWTFVLWDKKDQRERSYTFDMLELIASTTDKKLGDTRAYRIGTARGLIRNYAKSDWDAAKDALATIEANNLDSPQERIEKLKPQVLRNGRMSSVRMFVECIETKNQECGKIMIDGMLDALEEKHETALVRMAALYSAGIGVKQDPDAAMALLKVAEKRTGDKGLALYDFMYLQFDKQQVNGMPAKLKSFLETESFLPNKWKAAPAFVNMLMHGQEGKSVLKAYGAKLGPSALAGNEDSYELYALYFFHNDNLPEYNRWIAAAAKAGHPVSQRYYAADLQESTDKSKHKDAFHWILESARNGDMDAIIWLADYYRDRKRFNEAAVWYESSSNLGDLDSAFKMAEIYASEPEGSEFTEQDAINVYQSLSENHDSAKARRDWARLLMYGQTAKHDLAKAKKLLLQDANKADAESMAYLGVSLATGEFGVADEKEGVAWLEKAVAQSSPLAMDSLAMFLYMHKQDQASLARAKTLWVKAIAKNYAMATNNYAWTLCTTSYPNFGDAKLGLGLFKSRDIDELPISQRDTYAACLAANGDFKSAINQQQLVISEMKELGLEKDSSMTQMNARLSLYRKSMVYREPVYKKKP